MPADAPVVVAVVPARGGSKRLPRKNLREVLGRTLVDWVVDAALASGHLAPDRIVVSSDDTEVLARATARGLVAHRRPDELATDDAWTEPVVRDAVEAWEARTGTRADVVVWLNASVPEVTGAHVATCIERLLSDGLREVLTVDAGGALTSATRVLVRAALDQHALSVVAAVVPGDFIDVHTPEDLAAVTARLLAREPERSDP